MQNGPKTVMNRANPNRRRHLLPAQGGGNRVPLEPSSKGSQNAQRSYERYLALARAEALSGDMIGAENYYQHAEHYFRSMFSDRGTTYNETSPR